MASIETWIRRHRSVLAPTLVLGVAGLLLFVGLGRFGIWDPWELSAADAARRLASGEGGPQTSPPLSGWLVSAGFSLFGVGGVAGRLPLALVGLVTAMLAYFMGRRFLGARAGVYAGVITATSPLFLFNSRLMLGDAPAFLAQGLILLCASSALLLPHKSASDKEGGAPARARAAVVWIAGLLAAVALSVVASGVLLGALPPLLAVAAVALVQGRVLSEDRVERGTAIFLVTLGLALLALVAWTIAADEASYSHLIGGAPRGGDPPTHQAVLEQVFHAFAPWSALLPLALGRMLLGPSASARLTPLAPDPARKGSGPFRSPGVPGAPEDGEEPELEAAAASIAAPAGAFGPYLKPPASAGPLPRVWEGEGGLRLILLLTVAFGYGAQTVFTARFGTATFLPVIAASLAVALFLRDLERGERAWWAGGTLVFLFAALIVRDYRAYPDGPIRGLSVEGLSIPEVFNPRHYWEAVIGLFALVSAAVLAAPRGGEEPAKRPSGALEWARLALGLSVLTPLFLTQWRRGRGTRAWLSALGLLIGVIVGFSLASWVGGAAIEEGLTLALAATIGGGAGAGLVLLVALVLAILAERSGDPKKRLYAGISAVVGSLTLGALLVVAFPTSLAVRIGRVLILLPIGVLLLVGLGDLALRGLRALGQRATALILLAGVLVGAYASFGFLPALSSHFSPREVYDSYRSYAGVGEPLGEYRVGRRAAAYYLSDAELVELPTQTEAVSFLRRESRVWAAIPADDLPAIDRAYRRETQRHLFVADARSARVVLVSNLPVEGVEDQNYLANAILDQPPTPQFRSGINYDNKIELIGYDLELPQEGYVGPGQAFTIIWYWRCLAPVHGAYRPFLHIDGPGQRLNGDHDPVDGHYAVRLWDQGDIIVDRQSLRIPANYRRGAFILYTGFYAGETRLEIVEGPKDEENLGRAGVLQVR